MVKILTEKQVKPQIEPKHFTLEENEAALKDAFDDDSTGKVIMRVNQ
ncbi:hypothetical protein [Macrococcus equipercicus]|uniref:Alcohol dehydrogenase n=1 Tax=Macrococcus equipercicus TaxID=69967 RepID=A0A9Q9F3I9_9STAP|nr:hypothetical protein [Macrococcus equipercicus]UTH14084.1 hypothetical protein KFV11_01550 [Macrococcus equipercicus]